MNAAARGKQSGLQQPLHGIGPAAMVLLLCSTAFLVWLAAPQRRSGVSANGCLRTIHFYGSYFGAALVSDLHTCLAAGRLGNRVFQNLAVSLIAQRYDLATRYSLESECSRLGLRLYVGRQLMVGRSVALIEESLQPLLEGRIGDAQGKNGKEGGDAATSMASNAHFLLFSGGVYFQTPWFARKLRSEILPAMRESILRANPWRDRLGCNNDTFVHVRIGDMKDTARSFSNFSAAVMAAQSHNNLTNGRVFIASDSPNHRIVRELAQRFEGTVLSSFDRVEIIQFGATASKLVLSDGTFSWLIGVMSDVLADRTSDQIGATNKASVRFLTRSNAWLGDIFVFNDWLRL